MKNKTRYIKYSKFWSVKSAIFLLFLKSGGAVKSNELFQKKAKKNNISLPSKKLIEHWDRATQSGGQLFCGTDCPSVYVRTRGRVAGCGWVDCRRWWVKGRSSGTYPSSSSRSSLTSGGLTSRSGGHLIRIRLFLLLTTYGTRIMKL